MGEMFSRSVGQQHSALTLKKGDAESNSLTIQCPRLPTPILTRPTDEEREYRTRGSRQSRSG